MGCVNGKAGYQPFDTKSRFFDRDVSTVDSADIGGLYGGAKRRVLVGCAPCQPFSMYSGRYRQNETAEQTGGRWRLLDEFARVVDDIRPDVVAMENVPRVALHPGFPAFVERLRGLGYSVTHRKLRADHYGVPQKRSRLVLTASLHGPVEMAAPTHAGSPVTVRQAIGALPPIHAGTAHADDRLHMSRGLSEANLRRLRATDEGGSWKDWDETLRLDCHRKEGGESFRAVYGRMSWDEPSPVITTQCLGLGNGRFGHPEQDRAISIREAALLQSFPADFEFAEPGKRVSGERLARQIGNAVPVRLAEAVAKSIASHLASLDAA